MGVLTRRLRRTIPNTTASSGPAVTLECAIDTVQIDWPKIEQAASRESVDRTTAKMLIAARAEGANSRSLPSDRIATTLPFANAF